MHEFWYNYMKPRYEKKAKLYYMDTDSSIVYIRTKDIYLDIAKVVKTKFDTSNHKLGRPLPRGKNKKSSCINER